MLLEIIKEIIYIDNIQILLSILVPSIFFLIYVFLEIFDRFRDKIHESYHKGYKEASNDNLMYYATIKTIKDDFSKILTSLKKDFIKFPLETTTLLVEFNDNLSEYQNI